MKLALGVLVAVIGMVGLAALAGVPYTADRSEGAVIRLAWRARGERVQRCRRRSAAELAKLPVHMREEEVCERGMLPYQLRVAVDGRPVVDREVRAGGARADRPLFVFEELPVAPGLHRMTITFAREPVEPEEHDHDERRETPARLEFDDTVMLTPRAIVLVTYDDEQRRLRLLARPHFDP